jgi:hypothetical protein
LSNVPEADVSKLSEKIKSVWENLSPREKKLSAISGIIASLVLMLMVSYMMGGKKTLPVPKEAVKKNTTLLEPTLLEKYLYREKEQELRQRDEQMKALKAEIEEVRNERKKEKDRSMYPPVPTSSL